MSFRRLLGWLDQGVDSSGESYLEIRRRLVAYFDRKGCAFADDLADETLNRVARRLHEVTDIDQPPARYSYVVAKYVFLESLRQPRADSANFDRTADGASVPSTPGNEIHDRLLSCLEGCLEELTAAERDLILDYYRGELRSKIERRRTIATRLGLTANALTIRACRIRHKLEACVRRCDAEGDRSC